MTVKVRQYCRTFGLLTALLCLLSGCSGDDTTPSDAAAEIRFNADVWRVMEGTRATTYPNGAVEGSFKVYAYNYNLPTLYITNETVNYSSGSSSWENPQYWPEDNGALDFFAYMPATLPSYISFDSAPYIAETNPDGYSSGSPCIVCTNLPVSITAGSDATQELVYAYTRNQTKAANGAGVVLTFKRPFARIYFKLASGLSGVTINSVTIAGIMNNGSCTFDGTTTAWTPSGDAANLVVSGSPATGDTPYLVLPQTFDADLTFTVNATWSSWSNATKSVSTSVAVGSWAAGTSYTYTFNLKEEALIVETTKYTEQW